VERFSRAMRCGRVVVDEVHQRYPQLRPQQPQARGVEGLDEHRRAGMVEPRASQRVDQRRFEREPAVGEVSGTLRLGVDTDRATELRGQPRPQSEDLGKGRHRVVPVEAGVRRSERREPLDHAQGAELGEREVVDEPPGARRPVDDPAGAPVGELGAGRDVGARPQLRLVPRHQDAVGGRDEVGFEVVGAHPGGQLVGGERVLGAVSRCAAVADDEGPTCRHATSVAAAGIRTVPMRCRSGELGVPDAHIRAAERADSRG
jgi:hypothetical protein